MNQLGGFDKIKSFIPGLGKAKIPEYYFKSRVKNRKMGAYNKIYDS
jgi:hypothetical protein